ncbi:DUF805 domain-containing protein [Humidisolicoccus flavus]|uniref:DUF805 domain-containing protein n=1 Tax=Humidisolicoccus flavus TaxID=3111414 RepID=UPI0032451653
MTYDPNTPPPAQWPSSAGTYGQPYEQPYPQYGHVEQYPQQYGAPAAFASTYGQQWGPQSVDPDKLAIYGASLGQAWSRFWKKYVTFSGRASRSEFWWGVAIVNVLLWGLLIVLFITMGITGLLGSQMSGERIGVLVPVIILLLVFPLLTIALLLPYFALASRRLHDAGYSATMLFFALIPGAGGIIVIVFCSMPTSPVGDRYSA